MVIGPDERAGIVPGCKGGQKQSGEPRETESEP